MTSNNLDEEFMSKAIQVVEEISVMKTSPLMSWQASFV